MMTKYYKINEDMQQNCPNCGAPITSEICPYCGLNTGYQELKDYNNLPKIDCKEAHIGFWTTFFPLIFAFGFGFAGLVMPISFMISGDENFDGLTLLFFVPFALVGIVAAYFSIAPLVRLFLIKTKGTEIDGLVCGYTNDNVTLNGAPSKVAIIKIDTDEGPKLIHYQLGDTVCPYEIQSKIKLKVYKDMFTIIKDKKYYFN